MKDNERPGMSEAEGKVGLPPGSLVYLGEKKVDRVTVSVIDYDEREVKETPVTTAGECRGYIRKDTVTWVNVVGLHDTELLAEFGEVFGFHSLVLEDVLHTGQRPKMEDHEDYIFCVLQMLYRGDARLNIVSEQVSMILGPGYLLTFQEAEGDVFDVVRDRIRTGKGRIRKMGCDYLAYSIMDAIIDNYFVILEALGEKSEEIQETVIDNAETETLQAIHRIRRELIFLRKNLWPLRELVSGMEKTENRLIRKKLTPFLRDMYEHTIQVIDNVESLRDVLSGALDIYMTTVSNRTNDVMKVLTIIATIFIPLTFMAGIYGMNFEHMPELKWRYGYAGVWLVMLLIGAGMVGYFRRKKWF
ncbi:MAG: magnesium/cobalt transporter CorA [Kiritimatiellia bacterium]